MTRNELWSFENIKSFVLENVGLAIVPRITVLQELRAGTLVEIGLPEVRFHRATVMTFRRDCVSEAAGRLIEIMRNRHLQSIDEPDWPPAKSLRPTEIYALDSRSA